MAYGYGVGGSPATLPCSSQVVDWTASGSRPYNLYQGLQTSSVDLNLLFNGVNLAYGVYGWGTGPYALGYSPYVGASSLKSVSRLNEVITYLNNLAGVGLGGYGAGSSISASVFNYLHAVINGITTSCPAYCGGHCGGHQASCCCPGNGGCGCNWVCADWCGHHYGQ